MEWQVHVWCIMVNLLFAQSEQNSLIQTGSGPKLFRLARIYCIGFYLLNFYLCVKIAGNLFENYSVGVSKPVVEDGLEDGSEDWLDDVLEDRLKDWLFSQTKHRTNYGKRYYSTVLLLLCDASS